MINVDGVGENKDWWASKLMMPCLDHNNLMGDYVRVI